MRADKDSDGELVVRRLDTSSLSSVRAFAKEVLATEKAIHVLVGESKQPCLVNIHTFLHFYPLLHCESIKHSSLLAHFFIRLLVTPDYLSTCPQMNNAGIGSHDKRHVTEDGLELTMATNHFGHFLLTNLLLGDTRWRFAVFAIVGVFFPNRPIYSQK